MKTYKEIVRFEEILPANDFLTEELEKIRGGISAPGAKCTEGEISCKPSGEVKVQQGISAI